MYLMRGFVVTAGFGSLSASAAPAALHPSFFIPADFVNSKCYKGSYYSNDDKITRAHDCTDCIPAATWVLPLPFLII